MAKLGFWNTALESPDKIVIFEEGGRAFRAGEVLARANQLVHGLRSLGLKPGDTIVLALRNCAEFLEIALASLQGGWYFAPLDPKSTVPELEYVLDDSQAKVFLFGRECALTEYSGVHCFSIHEISGVASWSELWEGQPVGRPAELTPGDSLVYTSGTTGKRKAVRRPLGRVPLDKVGRVSAVHLNAVCGIRPRTDLVHLVCSSLSHSASLLWCLDHLHLGHTVVLKQGSGAARILSLIGLYCVTGALMVPTHFTRLLQLPKEARLGARLDTLRHVVHTGAPCPPAVKRQMLEWWGEVIYEVYGAAEGAGTRATPQEWLARPGTVGKGYGRIRILNPQGQLCAPGEVGAVYIKLAAKAFQYQNDPDKTDKAIVDGHFSVGDHGYLDEDDYLYLCGRQRDVVVSGGVNIYPAEVEAVLVEHSAVSEAAVFGVPDSEWGERLGAVVVLNPGVQPSPELEGKLVEHCRASLLGSKCPRRIGFVSSLPRNENGKLRRGELPQRFG